MQEEQDDWSGIRAAWRRRGIVVDDGSMSQRLLASRGIDPADQARFLKAGLKDLRPARELPGATDAAQVILAHATAGKRIVILGDYDVDGTTAAATLKHILRAVAPQAEVCIEIPHREDGYGLTDVAVQSVLAHEPALVITVDCGISAVAQVRTLRDAGCTVVVTDHHTIPPEEPLPDAHVIVHPARPDAQYGNPDLCACTVAWKIACEIARLHAGESMNQALRKQLAMLLPLAATASVADVIPMHGETRVIIRQGLEWFRETNLPGLRELARRVAEFGKVNAQGVAFGIAPILNAAGRIQHAQQCADLLALGADDPDADARAAQLVTRMSALNAERKEQQALLAATVLERVKREGLDRGPATAIVLADASWPHALVGIVAQKVIEGTGRPTLLGAIRPDGSVKWSARSIAAWDMGAAVARCKVGRSTGGGHPMAAGGLTFPGHFEAFAEALRQEASAALAGQSLKAVLEHDGFCTAAELNLPELTALAECGPFGAGSPAPTFVLRGCRLASDANHMKPGSPHLRFDLTQDGARVACVWFGAGGVATRLRRGIPCDVLGQPTINEYNGRRTPQVLVQDVRLL